MYLKEVAYVILKKEVKVKIEWFDFLEYTLVGEKKTRCKTYDINCIAFKKILNVTFKNSDITKSELRQIKVANELQYISNGTSVFIPLIILRVLPNIKLPG